jgi:hypothetical protein
MPSPGESIRLFLHIAWCHGCMSLLSILPWAWDISKSERDMIPSDRDSPHCQLSTDKHSHFDYPEGPEVDKYYPQFYHKMDKEGRPIYIEQLGKLDITKLYKCTTQERMLQHLVSEYEKFLGERLPACSAVKGHLVETSCTILDLHNAGISSFYKGEFSCLAKD